MIYGRLSGFCRFCRRLEWVPGPTPDIAQIPALIETFRAAGVAVEAVIDGDTAGLDPTVSLAAFQIVQEALADAHRHGRGLVELAIRCAEGHLSIVAENDCAIIRKTAAEAIWAGGYTWARTLGRRPLDRRRRWPQLPRHRHFADRWRDNPMIRYSSSMTRKWSASACAILDAQPNITVVGEAGDGLQAVRLLCELDVDVVLMDTRMPGVDGVEATRRSRQAIPSASSSWQHSITTKPSSQRCVPELTASSARA
jgi:CheY-like chemotaxis protein